MNSLETSSGAVKSRAIVINGRKYYPPRAGSKGRFDGVRRIAVIAMLAFRDGWQCHYCHCRLVCPDEYAASIGAMSGTQNLAARTADGRIIATIDHVLARCNGGDNQLENLVLSCIHCNCKKGSRVAW